MIKKKKEKGSNESNIEIQGDPKKQPIKILLTRVTLAIFKLSGKIPVVKDKLYMKHRCSAICSLAIFNTFMRMLFIPIALL